jgi:hypothetical protein
LHISVSDKSTLAAAAARFSAASGLQVWFANETAVAGSAPADRAAIGLAIRVLNEAAIGLLGLSRRSYQ